MAIDPGYDRLGVAVLEGDPSRPVLLMSDCVIPQKATPALRLAEITTTVRHTIEQYAPDVLGIEKLFFSVNKKTALGVAEARGTILATAGLAKLSVVECSPQEVKIAVTGHGTADKKAIAAMIPKLLTLSTKKRLDDEFDAIAVGITVLAQRAARL